MENLQFEYLRLLNTIIAIINYFDYFFYVLLIYYHDKHIEKRANLYQYFYIYLKFL